MTVLAAVITNLFTNAVALISSSQLGDFIAHQSWVPQFVASSNTVGSSDTYSPWLSFGGDGSVYSHFFKPCRVGAAETAAVYALFEAMMERQYVSCAGDHVCQDQVFGPTDTRNFDFGIYAVSNSVPNTVKTPSPDRVFRYLSPFDHSNTNRMSSRRFVEGANLGRLRDAYLAWEAQGFGPLYDDPDTMRPEWSAGGFYTSSATGEFVVVHQDYPDEKFELLFNPPYGFSFTLLNSSETDDDPRNFLCRRPGYFLGALNALSFRRMPNSLVRALFAGARNDIAGGSSDMFSRASQEYGEIDVDPPNLPFRPDEFCMFVRRTRSGRPDTPPDIPRFGSGMTGDVMSVSRYDLGPWPQNVPLWSEAIAGMNQRLSMLDTVVDVCEVPVGSTARVLMTDEGRAVVRELVSASFDGAYIHIHGGSGLEFSSTGNYSKVTIPYTGQAPRAHAAIYRSAPSSSFSIETRGSMTARYVTDIDKYVLEGFVQDLMSDVVEGEPFSVTVEQVDISQVHGSPSMCLGVVTIEQGNIVWGNESVPVDGGMESSMWIQCGVSLSRSCYADVTTNFTTNVREYPGQLARDLGVVDKFDESCVEHYVLASLAVAGKPYEEATPSLSAESLEHGYLYKNDPIGLFWSFDSTYSGKRSNFLAKVRQDAFSQLESQHVRLHHAAWDNLPAYTVKAENEAIGIAGELQEEHAFWPDRIGASIVEKKGMSAFFICVMVGGDIEILYEEQQEGEYSVDTDEPGVIHYDYKDRYPEDPFYGDAMMRAGTSVKFKFHTLGRRD